MLNYTLNSVTLIIAHCCILSAHKNNTISSSCSCPDSYLSVPLFNDYKSRHDTKTCFSSDLMHFTDLSVSGYIGSKTIQLVSEKPASSLLKS